MIDGIGKVALGYSYFNCVEEIERGLDPIYKQFDKIYCIDGRYINFEDKLGRDYSEDGSTELLHKYPNTVFDKVKPSFQTDKRQRYLDLAGEDKMDYLVVWDSDDIIHPNPRYQNWKKFWKQLKMYSERFPDYRLFKMKCWIPSVKEWRRAYNVVDENIWNPYIRIHKDPGNMRYCLYCHYWWCPKDATDEDIILQKKGMYIADQTIDGVRFTTNSALRGEAKLFIRDRWAWNNDCEEKRRSYVKSMSLKYWDDKDKPEWMNTELDGYWRYDDVGRPTTLICHEDGTVPKKTVYYNKPKG